MQPHAASRSAERPHRSRARQPRSCPANSYNPFVDRRGDVNKLRGGSDAAAGRSAA